MLRYAFHRIPSGVLILAVASVVIFLLLRATSGDPAAVGAGSDASPATIAAIRVALGLDLGYRYVDRARFDSLVTQLVSFIKNGEIEIDRPGATDPQFAKFMAATIAGAAKRVQS